MTSEGAGYYDSEGDYIPGPNDFEGEDDRIRLEIYANDEADIQKIIEFVLKTNGKKEIEGLEILLDDDVVYPITAEVTE